MKNISIDELAGVTGAGLSPRGIPVFGKIGYYEQMKNIGGLLHRRVVGPRGGTTGWHRYSPNFPNWEGQ